MKRKRQNSSIRTVSITTKHGNSFEIIISVCLRFIFIFTASGVLFVSYLVVDQGWGCKTPNFRKNQRF